MSRQVGKSLGCAFECVHDASLTGNDWLIFSAGERQAKEFISKVGYVALMYSEGLEVARPDVKVSEVKLWNGARITGLPSNPATARGYSRSIILDEAAFHEQPDELWRAVFPIITNPLKGNLKVRIISTPAGKNNLFYRLWSGEGMVKGGSWSRHKIDVYDAVKAGLDLNVEELRNALDDPDGWAQEYECEFLEEATQLFPYELIEHCTDDRATVESALPRKEHIIRYGGGDIGRHRDLSCSWLLNRDTRDPDGPLVTEEVVTMERVDFSTQQKIFGDRIIRSSRFAIDATGIGEETAERLTMKYGEGRVDACKLTAEFKGKLFPALKDAMQRRAVLIPRNEKIRKSLASVQKTVSQGGTIRYVAAHTADGHADEACALALAVWAARSPTGAISATQARQIKSPKPLFQAPRYRF